jgi:hypothetical protein
VAAGTTAAAGKVAAGSTLFAGKVALTATLAYATLKQNIVLFISLFIVLILQIVGIVREEATSISFAIAGLFSLFILFFVSLFSLIGNFGRGLPVTIGNISSHILNPANSFFILLFQTVINFFESFQDAIPFTVKLSEDIASGTENIANDVASGTENIANDIASGTENIANDIASGTENIGNDIASGTEDSIPRVWKKGNSTEGFKSCGISIEKDTNEITARVEVESMIFFKNILLLLTSILTIIYLFFINMYGTVNSFTYNVCMIVYLGLFSGYSYFKYQIYLFYKYYITDDF